MVLLVSISKRARVCCCILVRTNCNFKPQRFEHLPFPSVFRFVMVCSLTEFSLSNSYPSKQREIVRFSNSHAELFLVLRVFSSTNVLSLRIPLIIRPRQFQLRYRRQLLISLWQSFVSNLHIHRTSSYHCR